MRVLFAPDKFKGSLTAREAAEAMQRGWQRSGWTGETSTHPVADGGDGTLEVIGPATGAQPRRTPARDARGRVREVVWLWDPRTRTAWIESSRVAGLADLAAGERQPLTATTAGLGELLLAAAEAGAERVFVALGGSATNDAGCGMAAAAGFRFLDPTGRPLEPLPACLAALARIEPPARTFPVLTGLVDVDNPLLGPAGASCVYGPQKGATPGDVATLEEVLTTVVSITRRDLPAADPAAAGAGAAGGLGFGIMAFFGGQLRPGFDLVAEVTGLRAAVQAADLVVTGEGRLDAQTAAGKAPAGVARLARACGKPVIALAGSVPLTKGDDGDFNAVLPITNEPMTLEHAMQQAGPLLEEAATRAARLVRLGRLL
ncbi:MAG: glycerate kinase [Chthoniobacterales bacterium]